MQIRKDISIDEIIVFYAESSIQIQEKKLIKLIKKKFHVRDANYTWFDEISKTHFAEIKVAY